MGRKGQCVQARLLLNTKYQSNDDCQNKDPKWESKGVFEHAQNGHIQIILRMRKISPGSLHSIISNDSVSGQ